MSLAGETTVNFQNSVAAEKSFREQSMLAQRREWTEWTKKRQTNRRVILPGLSANSVSESPPPRTLLKKKMQQCLDDLPARVSSLERRLVCDFDDDDEGKHSNVFQSVAPLQLWEGDDGQQGNFSSTRLGTASPELTTGWSDVFSQGVQEGPEDQVASPGGGSLSTPPRLSQTAAAAFSSHAWLNQFQRETEAFKSVSVHVEVAMRKAVSDSRPLKLPCVFRTAVTCDSLIRLLGTFGRYDGMVVLLVKEVLRSVYSNYDAVWDSAMVDSRLHTMQNIGRPYFEVCANLETELRATRKKVKQMRHLFGDLEGHLKRGKNALCLAVSKWQKVVKAVTFGNLAFSRQLSKARLNNFRKRVRLRTWFYGLRRHCRFQRYQRLVIPDDGTDLKTKAEVLYWELIAAKDEIARLNKRKEGGGGQEEGGGAGDKSSESSRSRFAGELSVSKGGLAQLVLDKNELAKRAEELTEQNAALQEELTEVRLRAVENQASKDKTDDLEFELRQAKTDNALLEERVNQFERAVRHHWEDRETLLALITKQRDALKKMEMLAGLCQQQATGLRENAEEIVTETVVLMKAHSELQCEHTDLALVTPLARHVCRVNVESQTPLEWLAPAPEAAEEEKDHGDDDASHEYHHHHGHNHHHGHHHHHHHHHHKHSGGQKKTTRRHTTAAARRISKAHSPHSPKSPAKRKARGAAAHFNAIDESQKGRMKLLFNPKGGMCKKSAFAIQPLIADIYAKKMMSDDNENRAHHAREELRDFVQDFFMRKYGSKSLADKHMRGIYHAVNSHGTDPEGAQVLVSKGACRRIRLFGQLCGFLENEKDSYSVSAADITLCLLFHIYKGHCKEAKESLSQGQGFSFMPLKSVLEAVDRVLPGPLLDSMHYRLSQPDIGEEKLAALQTKQPTISEEDDDDDDQPSTTDAPPSPAEKGERKTTSPQKKPPPLSMWKRTKSARWSTLKTMGQLATTAEKSAAVAKSWANMPDSSHDTAAGDRSKFLASSHCHLTSERRRELFMALNDMSIHAEDAPARTGHKNVILTQVSNYTNVIDVDRALEECMRIWKRQHDDDVTTLAGIISNHTGEEYAHMNMESFESLIGVLLLGTYVSSKQMEHMFDYVAEQQGEGEDEEMVVTSRSFNHLADLCLRFGAVIPAQSTGEHRRILADVHEYMSALACDPRKQYLLVQMQAKTRGFLLRARMKAMRTMTIFIQAKDRGRRARALVREMKFEIGAKKRAEKRGDDN